MILTIQIIGSTDGLGATLFCMGCGFETRELPSNAPMPYCPKCQSSAWASNKHYCPQCGKHIGYFNLTPNDANETRRHEI